MRYFKRLNQDGDTIVEVLIVLAILSLAFAISTATANRGLQQSRNAQEHSQALGLLDSQIEELRTATSANANLSGGVDKAFCMTGPTTIASFSSTYNSTYINSSPASDNFGQYPVACATNSGSSPYPYYESIVYRCDTGYATCDPNTGVHGYFDLKVRWDGAGPLGRQQENMTYRIHPLTATASSGIPLTGSASQVVVKELDIAPDGAGYTPACSKTPNPGSHANINVILSQTNGSSTFTGLTDFGGTINFGSGIVDNGIYRVTSVTSWPSGWLLCTSVPTITKQPNGDSKEIDLVFQPQCQTINTIGPPYAHYTAPYAHYTAPYAHYTAPYEHYQTLYAWSHDGYGDYTTTKSPIVIANNPPPPNPPWGAVIVDPASVPDGTIGYQWIQTYKAGGVWHYGYNYYHSYNYPSPIGFYGDYIGTYSDYLGFYGDYIGTYGDPYSYQSCPT